MRTNWNTPLDIPPARAGLYEIQRETVPAPGKFLLAPETGAKPASVVFDTPTRWHRLTGPGISASDRPEEQSRLDLAVRPVTWGRTILLVGLDLGYLATVLARRKKIKRIVVVEPCREIIDLVWPYLLLDEPEARAKVEVIYADLYPWMSERRSRAWQFDWIIRDEFAHASIDTLFLRALPFRKQAAGIGEEHRTLVLGEDRMREACAAYLVAQLMQRAREPELRYDQTAWDAPFWRWIDEHRDFQRGALMIQAYARTVGLSQHDALWQSAISDDAARYAS